MTKHLKTISVVFLVIGLMGFVLQTINVFFLNPQINFNFVLPAMLSTGAGLIVFLILQKNKEEN